jgi:malonyl-CoA O-methyltransferase
VVRGLFVTGTDTNVGKTVVSATLMQRYGRDARLRYWKPIQTGIEQDPGGNDTAEVVRLGECQPDAVIEAGIRLQRPLSPHLAARLSGIVIELQPLVDIAAGARRTLIVEGAGGVLVPVNERELMTELMSRLGLPVLIVSRSTLGTINHTLLTIEALRRRSLAIAGVVMVGPPDADNREAIEQRGGVHVVGELPIFEPLTPQRLAAWAITELDRDGHLTEFIA